MQCCDFSFTACFEWFLQQQQQQQLELLNKATCILDNTYVEMKTKKKYIIKPLLNVQNSVCISAFLMTGILCKF